MSARDELASAPVHASAPASASAVNADQTEQAEQAEQVDRVRMRRARDDQPSIAASASESAPKRQRQLDAYQTQASESLTQSVSMMMSSSAQERQSGAAQAYDVYRGVFARQGESHRDNPSWWRQTFLASSDVVQLAQRAVTYQSSKAVVPAAAAAGAAAAAAAAVVEVSRHFRVSVGNVVHIFDRKTKRVVFVGRAQRADVPIGSGAYDGTVSRLAVIIYCDPALGRLLVIDVGGLHGVVTKARGDATARCMNSTQEDRRGLNFGCEEEATLVLGATTIIINRRVCAACEESMRDRSTPCTITVTCTQCYPPAKPTIAVAAEVGVGAGVAAGVAVGVAAEITAKAN
jgi:hypothetical protein